jgi:MoxR-like ATPase
MEEAQVSVEGQTYPLPDPFFVIATQNPLTFEGTFPLPEVQLDRFMATVSLGYPSYEDEFALLEGRHGAAVPMPSWPREALTEWKRAATGVHVSPSLRDYLLAVVRASRLWPGVRLGVSPRGALSWQALARAHAVLKGRDFLTPDDLKATAPWALPHRLVLEGEGSLPRKRQVLLEILGQQPVPR